MASTDSSTCFVPPSLFSNLLWSGLLVVRWRQFCKRKASSLLTSLLMNVEKGWYRKWMDCPSPRATPGGPWAAVGWPHWGREYGKGVSHACKPKGPLALHVRLTSPSLRHGQSSTVRKYWQHPLDSKYVWGHHEQDLFFSWQRAELIYLFSCNKA